MKSPEDRTYEDFALRVQEQVEFLVSTYGRKCESPIEILLFRALILEHLIQFSSLPCLQPEVWKAAAKQYGGWLVEPQKEIGPYRIDFLVTVASCDLRIVIECDSHDFHERTKEQAARDRSRDREIKAWNREIVVPDKDDST